jgi:flagellar hook protein FlgE
MIPSLYNGITALKSLSQGLQVLGNNIANVNSLGYKSSRVNYSDNFYLHMNDAESGGDGQPSNNIQQHGTGVHVGSISSNFNQGTIEVTGLDLDLAIQGEALPNAGGFFELADPLTGELFYTRAGAFESNNAGSVVTRDQYRYELQGLDNAVSVSVPNPQTQSLLARRVEENGVINVVVYDSELKKDIVTPVSQVKIVNFLSPQYLRRVGNGFYSNGRAGQNLEAQAVCSGVVERRFDQRVCRHDLTPTVLSGRFSGGHYVRRDSFRSRQPETLVYTNHPTSYLPCVPPN